MRRETFTFILGCLVVVALIVFLTWLSMQVYCTTYESHGFKYCTQLRFDGSHVWYEPIEK